jgi:hypothetical protein
MLPIRGYQANLLFKIVIGEEQDSIVAIENAPRILKVPLDILPTYNTLI